MSENGECMMAPRSDLPWACHPSLLGAILDGDHCVQREAERESIWNACGRRNLGGKESGQACSPLVLLA